MIRSNIRNNELLFPMSTLLSQLKEHSVIVADTGDFESIRKYQPRDATTNPSLLLKASQMPEYQPLLARAIADAKKANAPASQWLDGSSPNPANMTPPLFVRFLPT